MCGLQWQDFLAKDQHDRQRCSDPVPPGTGFSVLSLMEPLLQAPAIIPQLIMSFCAVSIVTYNKLSEIMTPFHWGNKIRSRINVTTGKTSFNWLFNTGAAIKCMNADSFREAFGHQKPRMVKKSVGCIAANGSRMESLGIFEIEITI
jgi:hypothetical protein